jgi:capsular exopolysaccharide synthesis family protein
VGRNRRFGLGEPPFGQSAQRVLWGSLLRWKSGFLVFAALGLLGGVGFTFFQSPVYEAHALIEVNDLNEDFLNIKQVTPVQESSSLDTLTDLETKVKAMQSPGLLRRAHAALKDNEAEFESWRPNLTGWRKFIVSSSTSSLKTLTPEALERMVKVRIVPQTKDIEVTVSAGNPRIAAAFANEICRTFIQENLEARSSRSRETGEWVYGLLKEARAKLERSEADLQAYANSAGLLFDSSHKNVLDDRLREIQEELTRARAERVAKQSRYELARQSSVDTLPEVIEDHTTAEYETRLSDLERQKAELSTLFNPSYGKLQRLQAEISAVKNSLDAEKSAVLAKISNEYWAAERRENLLDGDYQRLSHLVLQDANKAVRYDVLQREVDGNRQAYDALLQRAQEATVAAGLRTSNIRMLDSSAPAKLPNRPSLVLNTALGLFFGILFGSVWVFVRAGWDVTVHEPGDLPRLTNLPELGTIPHFKNRHSRLESKPAPLGLLPAPEESNHGDSAYSDQVILADSFRGVITSILITAPDRRPSGVFAVASAGPGEGKTTVVRNMGIAFAEVTPRVLLVDGDLRRGRLSELFDVQAKPGLTQLLQPDSDVEADQFWYKTVVPGISILGCGPFSTTPFRLVQSGRFAKILSRLRKDFDVVVIDTPPIATTPEARILSRVSDGIVVVARASRTSRKAAFAACERLSDDGSVVLGTVLNDWDPKRGARSHYGYRYEQLYREDRQRPQTN